MNYCDVFILKETVAKSKKKRIVLGGELCYSDKKNQEEEMENIYVKLSQHSRIET